MIFQPPHGYHVYCVRHIASNFNRKFNNAKQKEMLKKLEKFCELSPTIATWIDRILKEKWTMAYDREGRRYGHMTTNLSECINKVLKDCRNIPITTLVKSTYSRCRKYFVERDYQAQRQLNEGQVYCSKLVKELRKNQEQACSHIVRVYDIHSTRFEVEETFNPITQRGGQKWAFNLNGHYCQCGRYSALHYPCSHIIAACGYVSMNYYQYIDVVYTNEHILKAYSAQWWPLGNEAAIPPSNDAWTLIPDPTIIRAKGMRWIGSNHLSTDKNVVDVEPKGITSVAVQCNLSMGVDFFCHDASPLVLPQPQQRTPDANQHLISHPYQDSSYESKNPCTGSKRAIQIKRGISFNALKKKIGDKVKLQNNEIISVINCRFLVSGKYIALQICDDEDIETMLESFKQQQEMSILELYIEKDVTDDDHDDDDYLVSNSYVEESLDEDDSVDGISDTDNEVPNMIPPVRIIHPTEGVQGIQNPFWNDALHYNNINWSHPDEEDICGLEMPSSFNVGQELYVGMEFDSKDAVKNAVKQYVMKVHQSFKVVESKWDKYVVCCLNKNAYCPCPFYMRAILSKKNDSWKVTQWGGPHTCLNMTMTQDHEKLDSDLSVTCVVGMIREDPSIKISLIQERINSQFAYKVSYKKAWLAKQKAIAIKYGDWDESYAKLSSWLTHMQNHSPGSYFQILHDDFIVGNTVSREHRQFHRVFWTFGQCKKAFKYCKPIIQVDGTLLYDKYCGTLLMATSQDGNGGVLPLAFAVVEGETLTAWSWFLAHFREHVTDKNGICLISDRHASIMFAVANEALGWQPPHEKFRELSLAIATWIDRISKEKWTMTYDREGRRYGHMTTNLSECINKVLKDCRNIPITALVKSTYSRCRKYFVECGRQAQRQLNEGQVYCSKLVKELRKNQEQACTHIVHVYDIYSTRFEVEETFNLITQCGGQKWAVNLNGHHCQCGRYSALHYPCSHIIAACGYVSMNYYQYIDVVYTNEHILKAYSAQWWPLGNEAAIPPSDEAWTLIPDPTTIHAKGRPKSTRIRNEMDWVEPSEHRTKCSRCGAEGHNRRRCSMQSERGSCSNH
ncbi:hypothetical protein HKD37_16G045557 [Glycine soja]